MPELTINPDGTKTWADHTSVVGTQNGIKRSLAKVETLEDLIWSVPDRIVSRETKTITNRLVYSRIAGVETLNEDYQEPMRLRVSITGSTNYYRKTETRNPDASGYHRLIINGRDINYQPVVEHLEIPDDGVYITRNIFTLVEDVDATGFDGDVYIHLYDASDYIQDPYRIAVTDSAEGPLCLRIREAVETPGVDQSYIEYFTSVIKQGEFYRDGQSQLPENEEVQWEQHLQDEEGLYITPVDLAIHPETGRLYVLDNQGSVHVYNHGLTPFVPPSLEDEITLDAYIQIQPVKPWALLGETMKLFTSFIRMCYPILKVVIRRISPSGTTEYLQANKTWSASLYEWDTSVHADLRDPSKTWRDMGFNSEFTETGQWEFYCTVTTRFDKTTSYTGVMVDVLQAERTYETGVSSPICIFFDHRNDLVLGSNSSFEVFEERCDLYLPDYESHELIVRDEFEELEVQV